MKYKRLTKLSNLGTLHIFSTERKEIPLCDVSIADRDNLIGHLFELENKIESGELISTKEVGDSEIEFFVEHNKKVRQLMAEEIFSWLYDNAVNANFITGNMEISMSIVKDKAAQYGIDFFNNKGTTSQK